MSAVVVPVSPTEPAPTAGRSVGRGLSVREAAAASRIAFRPLRSPARTPDDPGPSRDATENAPAPQLRDPR